MMKIAGRTVSTTLLLLTLAACGGGGNDGGSAPPAKTLTTIAVSPNPFATGVGIARPVRATGTYSDNTTADLTASVQWTTSNANVATVSAAGVITGIALGTATIRATSGSTTGESVINVTSNSWSPAASLKIRREKHTATLIPSSGKVVVVGGTVEINLMPGESYAAASERSKLVEVEIYDPDLDSWSFAISMSKARASHTATLLPNGKVLVTGGDAVGTSAELYDPAANSWAPAASMGTPRARHAAVLLKNGNVLVLGGAADDLSTEIYDPALNTWTPAAPMEISHGLPSPSTPTAVLLSDGRVLVAGTVYSTPAPSAEIYDPVANDWSAAANMIQNRFLSSAALLKDGRALFAFGYRAGVADASVPNDAQIYDPVANAWTQTTPSDWGHAGTSAVVLQSGKVLVVGGHGGRGEQGPEPMRNDLYDPVADTWTAAGTSHDGRANHTATLLLNGAVLVTGGEAIPSSEGSALASCELYW